MDWVNPIIKINNKFKFQLFGRHFENLNHLVYKIPKFDPQNTGLMSEHTFNLFLNAAGVFLTTQEIRTIRDNFGTEGSIAYYDFIQNVRKDLSEKRMATVDHAFEQLNSGGKINIEGLLSRFQPSRHPQVRCLNKTQEKVRQQLIEGLQRWSSDQVSLTDQQFREYYLDVNACIPLQREEYFVDLIINSFGLLDDRVTLDRIKQMEVTVFEKVRQKTGIKKDEGSKSHSVFRFIDLQQKGIVNYVRFVSVLQKLGCKFSEKQNQALFGKYSSNGLLSYQNLCALLFDMGSGLKDNTNPVFELAKSDGGYLTTHGMTKKLH